MPYVLTVTSREERDAVVAALRQAADQRSRVAAQAAGEVLAAEQAAKAAGRRDDLRPAALRVTRFLGEANLLQVIADRWERVEEVPLEAKVAAELTTAETLPLDPPVDPAPAEPTEEGRVEVDVAAGIARAAANIDHALGAKVADDGPSYDAGADDAGPTDSDGLAVEDADPYEARS